MYYGKLIHFRIGFSMKNKEYYVVRKNNTTHKWDILFRNGAYWCYTAKTGSGEFRFGNIDRLIVVSKNTFTKFISRINVNGS